MISALADLAAQAAPPLAHAAHMTGDMSNPGVANAAWVVLLAPLAGCLLTTLGWRLLSLRAAAWIATAAIFTAFGAAVLMTVRLLGLDAEEQHVTTGYRYADALGLDFSFSLHIDSLAAFMCLVVSGVSALIHLYSVPYMTSDQGYQRFFSYLNFFVFSMLLLVLAGNLALLIVGWAFVGAASYLLISFWYRRHTATAAGIKAFVVNVIGDVGLVIGAFLLWRELGTLDMPRMFAEAADPLAVQPSGTLTAAMLLLLVGAFAKSAQLPLHAWLPDAMEGPTPVSALIHAATMVTAGVYLIARFAPLYEIATEAALVAAIVGCATMLFASSIALVQNDLKRIIAYSTMAQVGYMIMGVAAGAYAAGMFHLMTHAFFKALLFMAAGSVIAAMGGVQDIRQMGGMRRAMPFTFWMFLIGSFTLAGFPLLSGFFSKDEIISYLYNRGDEFAVLAALGLAGALMTAFYSLRMLLRVFFGERCEAATELERGHLLHSEHVNPATGEQEDTEVGFPGAEHHIAEREWAMKLAMGVLAALSVVAGALQIPALTEAVEHFLEPSFEGSRLFGLLPSTAEQYEGLAIGAIIALVGIFGAYFVYVARPGLHERLRERLGFAYRLVFNKYYVDELYDSVFVRPAAAIGRWCNRVFERVVVDGVFVGWTTGLAASGTRVVHALQNGLARSYAALVVFGVIAVSLYFYVAAR